MITNGVSRMKATLFALRLNELLDPALMSEILCLNNIHCSFAKVFEVLISLIIHEDGFEN